MSTLPSGWENRNNQMSEKDMKLGGDAANKFAAKGAYDDDGTSGYKTSEQVKAFYMQQIEQQEKEVGTASSSNDDNLPAGWEDRQKTRQVQAKQFGVSSSKPQAPTPTTSISTSTPSGSAEAALVKVATTTLDAMAQTLERNPVALSPEERAAFAAAMQRAMTAIAKCR